MSSLLSVYILLFWCWCWCSVTSQGIEITSFLSAESRRFVCPGEVAIYTCRGPGNEIDVHVPPFINSSSAVSFLRGDEIGTSLTSGPVFTNLVSTEIPMMEANVQVESFSSTEDYCIITCEVRSPFQSESMEHRLSALPGDVASSTISPLGTFSDSDEYSSDVRVSWTPPNNEESYDLYHYTVQLLQNDTVISESFINGLEIIFSVPIGMDVRARIMTTTKCGETSKGIFTESIAGSGVVTRNCMLLSVLVSAAAVALSVIV